jgi:hypothetical protein
MPRKRKQESRALPNTYTYSEEVYEVASVDGWRLNVTAGMLEWHVVWANCSETTWEPNCNASGYSRAIFAFLGTNPGLPVRHQE